MAAQNYECFGMFNDSLACGNCPAVKRCRAILVSDGFDILQALFTELVEQEAESGVPFVEKDKVSDNVEQLINPKAREGLAADKDILAELFGEEDPAPVPTTPEMAVLDEEGMVFD